jgi:hypothetical protein
MCPVEITANIVSVRAEEMADQSLLEHLAQRIRPSASARFVADFGTDGYVVVRGSTGAWETVGPFQLDQDHTVESVDVSGAACP